MYPVTAVASADRHGSGADVLLMLVIISVATDKRVAGAVPA